jgi:hypothetical protein
VLDVLRSERFVDVSVAQAYHVLLDEGTYLASPSTMYRLLRDAGEVSERRRQATHPPRVRPELVARAPNVVWSWDITKLRGPAKGVWYDLYVVLDIFSRYVVAWCVAPSESGEVAKELIADAVARQGVGRGRLTVHADRGSSMTSQPVAELLSFLGIARTHSRPHTSNDKALVSHCTSWGGFDRSSLAEARADPFHEPRITGCGWLEEPFVLVVRLVADQQAGAVPGLDCRHVDTQAGCHLGQGQQPSGTEPLGVTREAVLAA